ncbi:hypothetical protein V6N13_076196 [Hibiscus sabdariffa]
MVMDNCQPSVSMSDTLSHFVQAGDTWNKTVFGYIGTKKQIIMASLRGIQKALCSCTSSFLRSLESALILVLEHLLDQKELLWRQKSRSDWLLQGDRNTRYFHRRAVNRKQRNKITTLKLPDGTWCDDVSTLQDEATRYFASLFSKDIAPQDPFPSEYSFPMIHDSHLCHLDDLSSNDEIHAALSEMAPLKSSGWDGYTPSSFKVNGML